MKRWQIKGDAEFERLAKRGVDEGTRLLFEEFVRVDGVSVVLEKWSDSGIHGRSAVFLTEHVGQWDDAKLTAFMSGPLGLEVAPNRTITRRPEFTFVNYAFET